ncbi:hypothetical protein [Kitasatospora sp. NBC_01302]|uniref:hypothetical protein n=1 Tax=Kitasatospora sp. NBC_01302 TaxID=2903575 RepID=UPI002E164F64|nr:hypothetical protein OG294_27890 [Kitasatospora sp. NBC_01302]
MTVIAERPVQTAGCRLPDCDGATHDAGEDRFCPASAVDLEIPGAQLGLEFTVEIYDDPTARGPQLSLFGISSDWYEAFLHRTTVPGEVIGLAEHFERLADQLRRSAVELAELRRRAGVA